VRSPAEWQQDCLPNAINLPVLNNEERAQIGTLYSTSAFEAKKVGAAKVARNIAHHLETALRDQPRSWRPLIYCWRGGNRSNALALICQRIGWKATVLEGGYTAFRRALIEDLAAKAAGFDYRVVCGVTGSGKSQFLRELASEGHQVLDLEALAHHRGSLLGTEPEGQQPSQKSFETQIWDQLRRLDPSQPVFVESESRKIGSVQVPAGLIEKMRQSPCIELTPSMPERVAFLCQEYDHFFHQPKALISQLERLKPLVGAERLGQWIHMIEQANWPALVESLLTHHYDPAYRRSMEKNYLRYAQAKRIAHHVGNAQTPPSSLSAMIL
jgi:tRNA 2-selenouridine synthase